MCRRRSRMKPTTEKNAAKTPHFFAAYKTGRENWFLKEYKRWKHFWNTLWLFDFGLLWLFWTNQLTILTSHLTSMTSQNGQNSKFKIIKSHSSQDIQIQNCQLTGQWTILTTLNFEFWPFWPVNWPFWQVNWPNWHSTDHFDRSTD